MKKPNRATPASALTPAQLKCARGGFFSSAVAALSDDGSNAVISYHTISLTTDGGEHVVSWGDN